MAELTETEKVNGDRELLELAAKAAGYTLDGSFGKGLLVVVNAGLRNQKAFPFDPLTDDGDALRLAVKLSMDIDCTTPSSMKPNTWAMSGLSEGGGAAEYHGEDPYAATRRAIVRAAAAIGKAIP